MDTYDGPICYVGHDHEAADGHPLLGGWHYTVVEGLDGTEMPGERLWMSEKTGKCRLAKDGDQSWYERHHQQLVVVAPEGQVGEPRTAEEFEATHRHLDELEKRLKNLDAHEATHTLRTKEEIGVVRGWLKEAQARRR